MRKNSMLRFAEESTAIPAVGEGKLGPAGHLGYLLRQAANAHRRRMDRALSSLGLNHPQFLVLMMISAYPGCSNAEIARLAMLTPQTVHAIITGLQQKALIVRRPDGTHGRILNIDLTDAGRELLEHASQRAHELELELGRLLSETEGIAVRRWLVEAARAADRIDADEDQPGIL